MKTQLQIFLKAKLLSLFMVMVLLANTVQGQALQATGGSGLYKKQIWWADFSGVSVAAGNTLSRNFTIGNINITVNISNVSFSGSVKTSPPSNVLTPVRLVGYKSGSWREDGLDNLYNIGGTGPSNSLTNALNTNFGGVSGGASGTNNTLISNFKITAYATLNGKPVSLAMVYASAEADGNAPAPNNPIGIEYTQGTTNGSPWQLIEKFTTANQANGNRLISFSNNDLTALMSMGSHNQGTSETNATPSNVAILHTGKNATSPSNALIVDAKMVSGGSSAIAIGFIVGVDTGDLPATYGSSRNSLVPTATGGTNPNPGVAQNTYLVNGLASPAPLIIAGTLVNPNNLKIGTNAADADVATVNTNTANGDDTAGTDDEDGLDGVTIGGLYSGLTTYSLNNIPVTNSTGSTATLVGWVDFNQNGTFETGEGALTTVINGATTASLSWAGLTGVAAGKVNIRLKLSTDTDLTTATPTGESINGETEDHQIIVCNAGTAQVSLASTSLSGCPSVNLNNAFTGTAPTGSSLVWFLNDPTHSGTALTPAQASAVTTSGTYYAFFYDSVNGCYNTANSTSSVLVTITTGPPTLGPITGPTCIIPPINGQVYSVPAVPGATTYTWTYSGNFGATGSGIVLGSGTNSITVNYGESPSSGTLSVTVTTACGTSTASTLAISVLPKPSIATLGESTICPDGGSVLLTSTPAPAYQWRKDGVDIPGATNQNYTASATGAYTVITSSGSCVSIASELFNVIQQDTTPPTFVSPLGTTTKNVKIDFRNVSSNPVNLPQIYNNIEPGALAGERVKISQSTNTGTIFGQTATAPNFPSTSNSAGPAAYGNLNLLMVKNSGDPIRTIAFNFDQSVFNLKFSLFDIDGATKMDARAYNNGALQPITIAPLKYLAPNTTPSSSPSTTPIINGVLSAYAITSPTGMRAAGINVDVPGPANSFILATTTRFNGDSDFYISQISYDYTSPILPADVTIACGQVIPEPMVLTATDNCSPASVVYTQVPATYTPSNVTQIITRTWVATDTAGNASTYIQKITVEPSSPTPTLEPNQSICATNYSTLANISITGTNIKWYADATTLTELPSTTVLTNGATYYATQNTGSCESFRKPVTVTLRSCSWINPSLRSKASK